MLGFSWKRFLVTLGLSILVWLVSAVIQTYVTFGKYVATFTTGCQVTGYPVDLCDLPNTKIPALLIIGFNVIFWFWVIHLFLSFLLRSKK